MVQFFFKRNLRKTPWRCLEVSYDQIHLISLGRLLLPLHRVSFCRGMFCCWLFIFSHILYQDYLFSHLSPPLFLLIICCKVGIDFSFKGTKCKEKQICILIFVTAIVVENLEFLESTMCRIICFCFLYIILLIECMMLLIEYSFL